MNEFVALLGSLGLHRRFAVDVLSVAHGVRPAGLLHVPLAAEPRLTAALSDIGLRVFARRSLVRCDDPNSREAVLRDWDDTEGETYAEVWYSRGASDLPSPADLFANPGRHLGYPTCCVAEWERLQSQRDLYHRYLFETSAGLWEVNRLSAVFQGGLVFPDFYPCSLACEAARAFVVPILEAAARVLDRAWVEHTIQWMRAPVLIHQGIIYAFPTWTLIGSVLELHTAGAARVPLDAVGRFQRPANDPPRLIPFRHLADAARVVLVGGDGVATDFMLPMPQEVIR